MGEDSLVQMLLINYGSLWGFGCFTAPRNFTELASALDGPSVPHLSVSLEKRPRALSCSVYADFKMAPAILDFSMAPSRLVLLLLLLLAGAVGLKIAGGTIASPHTPLAQLLAGLWGF
ncbi:hypothetical protein NDU88_006332 [Pleurodeles waltl]|uniref:Uncharacterized protein n=1 Tax=Pleurodeles waltl TaxID=8319 RepID=A0AAV7MEN4_PLEWA|nr:hypothetical protein NDU88_006332 [Pleurodeles waltl]